MENKVLKILWWIIRGTKETKHDPLDKEKILEISLSR